MNTRAARELPLPDRRDFLRTLGRGALGGAVLPALPQLQRGLAAQVRSPASLAAPGVTADEPYWQLVKDSFPLRAGVIPMNAANLCPAPRMVVDAVVAAQRDVEGDVSFQNRAQFDALRERVRARMAAYLGADAGEVALVRNTTEANNIIAGGVPLGAGDEVVLHAENHPSNAVSWEVRAARYGFTVRTVAARPEMTSAELLATFADALSPRTRLLSFTDVSNTTGIRLPARELCALARERGVHVHVDGAQSFGALHMDLHALGCDSYSGSAHKWFMGPKEAGVLYVRAARVPEIWPGVVGVGWSGAAGPRDARRFETLGQRNDAVFAGLDAALELHETIGPDVVERRVYELAALLKAALVQVPGLQLVTPADAARSAGVVIARIDGADMRALYERLYREHGVAGASTGGLRLCPHVYNTIADVRHAADAVAALVAA